MLKFESFDFSFTFFKFHERYNLKIFQIIGYQVSKEIFTAWKIFASNSYFFSNLSALEFEIFKDLKNQSIQIQKLKRLKFEEWKI